MKTINTYYTSNDNLSSFIQEENINDSSKLLIQVFTTNNDFSFIHDMTQFFFKNFPLSSLIGSNICIALP
jgi:hypothetical protein